MSFILKLREQSTEKFNELHAEELAKVAGGGCKWDTYTTGDKNGDNQMDDDGCDD